MTFLNNELQAALQGNVKILDDINNIGADGFWRSEPIKRYIKEAVKAGVPLKTVRAELEKVFDYMVGEGFKEVPMYKQIALDLQDLGVAGDNLNEVLPNVFAILQDPKLDPDQALKLVIEQFKMIGMTAKEAEDRAKKFFNMKSSTAKGIFENLDSFNEKFDEIKHRFSTANGSLIMKKFTQGIRDGLTRGQILDSISKSIYDATYTNGIAEGLEPGQAARDAQAVADSVKGIMNTEFDDYFKEIEIKGKWDGISNGQEVPPVLRRMFDKDGKFTGTADTAHQLTLDAQVTTKPAPGAPGSSASTPMWVRNVAGTPGGGNSTGGNAGQGNKGGRGAGGRNEDEESGDPLGPMRNGGYIKRGTGGMIYGPGGPTDDLIPTMLSNGEYVIRASSVNKYGIPTLDMINKGAMPKFAEGGYSSRYPLMASGMANGGYVKPGYAMGGLVSGKESEYNINVYIEGTNSSPDDIANRVMQVLQRRDKMNRAGIRI